MWECLIAKLSFLCTSSLLYIYIFCCLFFKVIHNFWRNDFVFRQATIAACPQRIAAAAAGSSLSTSAPSSPGRFSYLLGSEWVNFLSVISSLDRRDKYSVLSSKKSLDYARKNESWRFEWKRFGISSWKRLATKSSFSFLIFLPW